MKILILFFSILLPLIQAFAVEDPATLDSEIGLTQLVGNEINLALQFTNQDGEMVALGSLFNEGKPVILIPVYYGCPRLCGLVLDAFTKTLTELQLKLGTEFVTAAISFDSTENSEHAKKRATQYRIKLINNTDHDPLGWHFLTGDEDSLKKLLDSIGFRVKKEGDSFAHTATLVVLTPAGKVSRYFPGIEFSSRDLRLSLVEAAAGQIGSVVDTLLMYCFRFDPSKGRYTWAVFGLLRVVGVLMLIGFGLLYWNFWNKS